MATTAIQQPAKKPMNLLETIVASKDRFALVSTKYLTPDRLVKLAQVMVSKVPDLQKCSIQSVLTELMTCARLGLEPHVEGGRYLIPFRQGQGENARYEVVGVTDYRGLVDIARRSGEVLAIHADVRRANDVWEYWVDASGNTLVHLLHRRAEGERGEILGAYAVVKLKNGEIQAEYLPLDQVNAVKARSKSAKSDYSPWQTDWEAMAKKTAIRRLYNLLPKTPDIAAAQEVIAEEDEQDRVAAAKDVTPPPQPTAGLKEKLRTKAQQQEPVPAAPPDQALEPGHDPDSMAHGQFEEG
jgi:recombination protein RecT